MAIIEIGKLDLDQSSFNRDLKFSIAIAIEIFPELDRDSNPARHITASSLEVQNARYRTVKEQHV